jgi:hypothetical protein
MKKDQVAELILGSTEVQEMLYINRSRLAALVTEGKLKPFKQLKNEKLFWLPEVESYKKEMLKNPNSKVYKMEVLKHAQ